MSDTPGLRAQEGTRLAMVADALGPELTSRAQPQWPAVLLAVSGASIAFGLILVSLGDIDEASRTKPLLMSAALIAIGYGLLWFLPRQRDLIRSASVALISFGIIGVGALVVDLDDNSIAPRAILIAALSLVAWLLPLTRGRPWLLGVALTAVWYLCIDVVTEVAVDTNDFSGVSGNADTEVGVASVILGLAYLGILHLLDRRGWHGALATPFAAVGDFAFVVGIIAVLSDITSAAGVGTLVLAAGLLLVVIGARGRNRRVTTWLGGLGIFVGLVSYVVAISDDATSATKPGLLFALLGIVLGGAAILFSDDQLRARFVANGSQSGPPTETGSETTSATVGGDGPVAGWYPDPMNRHELRLWDGTRWTSRISDGGIEGVDPVG